MFLQNKEKLFSTLTNLQTKLFRIELPESGPTYRGKWLTDSPTTKAISHIA